MASSGARTSSITVFIGQPPNFRLKIGQQLLKRLKAIFVFAPMQVTMIPFPSLVIEAENAFPIDDIRQAVLIQMR